MAIDTDPGTDGMILGPSLIIPDTINGTVANGKQVYLDTSGELTCDEPTTATHTVRIVGYVVKDSANIILFRPDNSYILLA